MRVVGGNQLRTPSPQGTPSAPEPLAFSTDSSSERSSPQAQDGRVPRTSSLEMTAFNSPPHCQSTHDATITRPRSISPPIVHANVSYTRGPSSTSRSAPRQHQRGIPRGVVQTPTDLDSYPSGDNDSSTSPFSSNRAQEELFFQSPAVEPNDSVRAVPRTPTGISAGRTVVVETPLHLQSFPSASDPESTTTPPADSILSPLSSPRLTTPGSSPGQSRRTSVGSTTGSPRRQHSPRERSTSSRNSHPRWEPSVQHVYFVTPYPGDHSQCQHTCPHCKVVSVYSSRQTTPVSLSHPMHVRNVMHDPVQDPRSPMGMTSTILNDAPFVFCLLRSFLPSNNIATAASHYSGDRRPR